MSDPGQKWRMARNISYLVGAAMAFIGLAVFASAPLLIRILFGQDFISAAPALEWLMPGVVFISMTGVWSMYVGSIDIPLGSIGVFFAMSALNIGLNFALLP